MLLSLCLWVDSTMQGSKKKKKHEHVGRDVGTPENQQVYFAFRAVITSLLSWVVSMSPGQLWGLCLSHSLLSLSAWRLLSKFVIGGADLILFKKGSSTGLKEWPHVTSFDWIFMQPPPQTNGWQLFNHLRASVSPPMATRKFWPVSPLWRALL